MCETLQAYGATVDGGFAPWVAVKARNVHSVGALPLHVAALAEPMACVMHGVDRTRVTAGTRTLIFGAGPIGLMMMMGLGTRGVTDVTMVDLEPSRLEQAKALGAAATLDGRDLDPAALPDRFDLVIDCTGVAAVCERLPRFARDGATILFFGVCPPAARASFSPNEIFRRELVLLGSHSLSDNLPDALDVLAQLGPRAEALVSNRLPLEGVAEQLRSPAKKGTMKIQYSAEA